MPHLPEGKLVTVKKERIAYGYYAKAGSRLAVFFHGNGELFNSFEEVAALMLQEGFSVLLVEYPGYGVAAAHSATEKHIYEDTTALLNLMKDQYGHKSEDVLLWGFSIGTGVAVEMAAKEHGGRLILMAPFTSIVDVGALHFGFLARWLIVDTFDSKSKAKNITIPVLIVHGERDSVIPVQMGQELSQIFPRAEFIAVPQANHSNLFQFLSDASWEQILKFAKKK